MRARSLLGARGLGGDRGSRKVLRGVDFSLSGGEVVALLGVNGSGKSTLLESLAGLHPMTGGSVQEMTGDLKLPLETRRSAWRYLVWPLFANRGNVW